jgi:glycosyltransferase involved in cell wall biosynthesis
MSPALVSDTPLITVYMPTHNRQHLLPRAVNSVLAQTYQHFELIIVDDASSDGTAEYLKRLSRQEPRIKLLTQSRSEGACVARNLAINLASGQYITGLDDDDEFLPTRLVSLLEAYCDDYAFVCQGFYWHYGSIKKAVDTQAMNISLLQMFDYNYASNQVFTLTSRLQQIGGFDAKFPACQDYDTWTRLIAAFGAGKRIAGASYVIHQGHEGPRVTAKKNKMLGYQLYFRRNQDMMTARNKSNQQFMSLMASNRVINLRLFAPMLLHGFFIRKCRYFIASHFKYLSGIRAKWLKSGWK